MTNPFPYYGNPPGNEYGPGGILRSVPMVNTTAMLPDGVSVQFDRMIPALGITPGSSLSCLGIKAQGIQAGTGGNAVTTPIFQQFGRGIMKRLWIAIDGIDVEQVFIQIYVDDSLVFGNLSQTFTTDGLNVNGLPIDKVFQIGGGHNAFFMSETVGSSLLTTSGTPAFGGYLTMDMPFERSILIVL